MNKSLAYKYFQVNLICIPKSQREKVEEANLVFEGRLCVKFGCAAHWAVGAVHWLSATQRASLQCENFNWRGAYKVRSALGCAHDALARNIKLLPVFSKIKFSWLFHARVS